MYTFRIAVKFAFRRGSMEPQSILSTREKLNEMMRKTMKSISSLCILSMLALSLSSCNSGAVGQKANLSTKADSVSYSLGYNYGRILAQEGIDDLDLANYAAGVYDAMFDSVEAISSADRDAILMAFQQELQAKQEMARAEESEKNLKEGEEFLAANRDNEGVVETESGLQYRVIEEGTGEKPAATNTVEVHYRGTLLSGEEFDSSYKRNQTATFPLNRVIEGWTEGLQLMSVGSKYEFFIPAYLAYGDTPPQGSPIKAGSVLIFEVELIDIVR